MSSVTIITSQQATSPKFPELCVLFLRKYSVGIRRGSAIQILGMANGRAGHARWRREVQEDDYVALEQVVQAILIPLDNLSSQLAINMESLIKQRSK